MSKSNSMDLFKSTRAIISKRTPEILTGLGIAGMITTTALAVKATPKALKLIEDEKNSLNYALCKEARDNNLDTCNQIDHLTPIETVKVTWKCYIPAAVTGVASVACLIGASSVNTKRSAALVTAYKLSEAAITEYRDKVIETIGEKKEQTIRDKMAEETVRKNPASKSNIILTNDGDSRFFDTMSGRHFYSNIEKVKSAVNELNRRLIQDMFGYVSLNDFYDELGLSRTDVGDIVGWNTDRLLDIGINAQVDDDGKPSIVLDYRVRPDYGYDK